MTYNPSAGAGISDGDKGDITVSGSGAAWAIDAGVVTTTKLGGDITAAGIALLNDATAADQRTTLGLGTAATTASTDYATAAQGTDARTPLAHTHAPSDITGTAVVTADARLSDARTPTAHVHAAGDITSGTVDTARLGSGTANSGTFLRGDQTWAAASGGVSDGDKGDITVSASGATWTIDAATVTLAKQADLAANSIVGNNTGSPATPLALSAAQVKTLLAIASGDVSGLGTLATQSGTFSGTSSGTNTGDQTSIVGITGTKAQFDTAVTDGNFLYVGDVTTNATHTGDVTGSGALTIAADAVTYAKMQNAAAGNVVLARAAATSGDFSEVAVGASQLLGRGSTGDVAAITLGSGLSMSGTTLSSSGGASPVVYVAAGDTAINSVTDVTVVTRDVTSVGTTDKLVVEADFTILNASGAARVYIITLDFDGLFDVEFTTGSLAVTTGHYFNMRGVLDIRSASLAYGTFTLEGGLIAGLASGVDTTTVATHLRTRGWGTTASDASGTTTVALKIRSAAATATQTCRLHVFTISKHTPT